MSSSRFTFAAAALLAIGGVTGFLVLRAPEAAPGALAIEPDPVDFGDVPWLTSPRLSVRIVNRSDHPVMLRNPHFTCSCFGILTPLPTSLRPGASGTFEIQMWSTKGTPGRFHKELSIDTDDPTMPTLKTPVIGTITDYRTVSPAQVVLGSLEPDSDPLEKKVEVRGGSGYDVSVAGATVSDKRISAEVRSVKGGADVIVRTVAKPAKGVFSAQIQLSVDVQPSGEAGASGGTKHRYTENVRVSGEIK